MRPAVLLPIFIFLTIVVVVTAGILSVNTGKFVYTLDDPYIHLALAENILRGHYGVNLSEVSAPSSSIIWAFLLALTGAHELSPLFLSVAAAVGALFIGQKILTLTFPNVSSAVRTTMTILFIFAFNLVSLTFSGMEHVLQIFVAVLLVYGLILADRTNDIRLLAVAIIINPLVRYENLALSLPALAYLMMRGRVFRSIEIGVFTAMIPLAFSVYLVSNGLQIVPTSLLAKASMDIAGKPLDINSSSGAYILFVWLTVVASVFNRHTRRLMLTGILAGVIFLLRGSVGRYEWFMLAALILIALYVWRFPIQCWLNRTPVAALMAAACFAVIPLNHTRIILPGSNNIYEQQYQMHRFVTEYWQQPIAVNDLGWVSYQNDAYVLDLFGLASLQALQLRKTSTDLNWMPTLMRESGVKAAILYEHWFPGVEDVLIDVGTMHLSGPKVATAGAVVHFYALDRNAAGELRSVLFDFSQQLPAEIVLNIGATEVASPAINFQPPSQ